jgi:magnesium chelatase subunit D
MTEIKTQRQLFPFSALLGQEQMKLTLLLNAVDPGIGGVLIRGEKGTGKSTAVRALAALLPEIDIIKNCPFSCDPADPGSWCDECLRRYGTDGDTRLETGAGETRGFGAAGEASARRRVRLVDFPLNATGDMVTGSIDFGQAVQEGKRVFQPGILAEANRGILYIDEVNLLDDHLVDLILDVSASNVNRVEREGISFTHPSRFILVGTMNPEEGDLRAQLLDRFGLCIDVRGSADPETRVELMELRERFDNDPRGVAEQFVREEREAAESVRRARELLPAASVSRELRVFIGELCAQNNTAGHRADLIIERAAKAYACLQGRAEPTIRDAQYVARYGLIHRSRTPESHHGLHEDSEHPFGAKENEKRAAQAEVEKEIKQVRELKATDEEEQYFPSLKKRGGSNEENENTIKIEKEQVFDIGETFKIKPIPGIRDRTLRRGTGKRNKSYTGYRAGRYVRSRPAAEMRDVAFDATLRTAAPCQRARRGEGNTAVIIKPYDIQEKVREKKIGNFFLFIVDASASMAAQQRMAATKGAIFSLLMDAYQKRDKAAMVIFQKKEARVLLPPTSSIDLAGKMLKELPVGGRTPLAQGLLRGYSVLHNYLLKEPDAMPVAVILTDGKANIGLNKEEDPYLEALHIAERMSRQRQTKYIVVDTLESRQANLGTARRLADALKADYYKIEDLKTTELVEIVRSKTS